MAISKGYTDEEVGTIVAEFKASGKPITVFCKERAHKPSYQTLKGWLDAVDQAAPAKSSAPAAPSPTTPEGIKAEIARLQGAYKESLLSKVDRLKSDIEKLQQELAEANKELEEITA